MNHPIFFYGDPSWPNLLFLKFFPTTFDPGAISLPGVLKNCKKSMQSASSGRLFRFILKHPKKGAPLKICLRAVQLTFLK